MNRWLCGLALGAMMTMSTVQSAEHFVDAELGKDSNSGLSVVDPWRSVRRVNRTQLQPGDTVRFKAGGVWRESLICQSGAEGHPVIYTSYGEGPKPAFLASVDLCSRDAWKSDGGAIWKTRDDTINGSRPFPSFAPGDWGIYCDGNGLATLTADTNDQDEKVYTLRCLKNGERATNIQLNYYGIDLEPEQVIRYRFRAKATTPFTVKNVALMRAQHPWGNYGTVLKRSTDITTEWQEHDVVFRTTVTESVTDGRLSFFIGDAISEGNQLSFVPLGAELIDCRSLGLTDDVGNIILTAKGQVEKSAGWKRWSREDLKGPGDFFHDPADKQLYIYSEQHPADVYSQFSHRL